VVTTPPVTRVPAPPSHRRAIAFAVGGAGLASTAVGLAFGLHARTQWSTSRDNCDAHNVCNETGTTQIASARSSATIATWTVGAGAAMLVTAAVIWWRAPSKREQRVSVLPSIDPHGASVSAFARF
jgi:hypothetical protein